MTGFSPLPRSPSVSVPGFRLNVLDLGRIDDPAVVLIHGGGTWMYSFRHLWDALAAHGLRVLALDMPGHGYTFVSNGYRPAYTLEMMCRVLGSLLVAKKVQMPVRLVGNSWGGGWALRFAQQNPGKIHSLVLLSASGFRGRETWLYESLKYPLVGELTSRIVSRTLARRFYRQAFFNPDLVSDEMVDAAFAPMAGSLENRQAQYRLMRRLDWRITEEAMAATSAKTLVLWGREDRLWPVSMAARFGATLPRCEVEVFAGCGHLPHEEQPEKTLGRLLKFWND